MRSPTIAPLSRLAFAALTLVVGALLCWLMLPPVVAFAPARLPAMLLWGAGAALLAGAPLLPRRWPRCARLMRFTLFPAGALVLWLLIGWCVFSQISLITEPRSFTWGVRATRASIGGTRTRLSRPCAPPIRGRCGRMIVCLTPA